MILFSGASLRRAVEEFVVHYNQDRNHQSLGNRIINPLLSLFPVGSDFYCRKRLGGLRRYYIVTGRLPKSVDMNFWTLRGHAFLP